MYICFVVLALSLGLFPTSCVKDLAVNKSTTEPQDAFLSVEEAQAFFEDSFTSGQTRSGDENKRRFLDPGEYTPQWDDAQTSQNEGVGSVDVPILSEYKYRAIRSEFKNGKAKVYVVELSQKLVVVKSKITKAKAQYVLTLIPDKAYYEKNKNRNIVKRFLNSGDKDEFSGYALYTLNGFPARLNKYKKGEKIAGVSIIGITDQAIITKRLKTILRELSKMKFQRKEQFVQTRSGEDDYGWGSWLEDNWDNFNDGGSIDFNDDGGIYVDYDGDSYTDKVWIGEVTVTPDPDPWPEDENEDPWSCYCGCCSECWYCGVCDSCNPPEPEYCNCGCCSECGYCGVCSSCDPPEPEPEIPDPCEDPDMQYAVFDFYINSPAGAGRAIQNAVNELSGIDVLDVDGVIDPNTIEELNKMDHQDVYNLFLDNRKQHYRDVVNKNPTQAKFLNGWLNRTNTFKPKTNTQEYNVNC